MTCKRGHGVWFQTKRAGKKVKVCEFIMGYRLSEGVGDSVLFCCDLKKGAKLPKGYIQLGEVST